MIILGSQNKITDFFMILAWASPFKQNLVIDVGNICEPFGPQVLCLSPIFE